MNQLYYGDNLNILREHVSDESVDLIYLDPPFNSNRSYNVLFKEANGTAANAQIKAFDDTWRWGPMAQEMFHELELTSSSAVRTVIQALFDLVDQNDVMAYLVMMTVRLVELHRILKPTGSIYLHCDPTASHYLKVVMDAIFGKENFINEVIWQRTAVKGDVRRKYGAVHDTLLFYAKSSSYTFLSQYVEPDNSYAERFRYDDHDGRGPYQSAPLDSPNPRPNLTYEYKGYSPPSKGWRVSRAVMEELDADGRLIFPSNPSGRIRRKVYLREQQGPKAPDMWCDIPPLQASSAERLGYPTQKPLALLERIISASSQEDGVVLDPFCGCGTAVVAAEKLGRQWIGIDITHLAIALMRNRLDSAFGDRVEYEVKGVPVDAPSARALAKQDPHEFQQWAVGHLKAQPAQEKRGADKGLDGVLPFIDEADAKAKKAVIQVKSGHVQASDIRDLCHVVEREKAVMGLFITLENPTGPMEKEALGAGYYHSRGWNRDYRKVQIRTVEQLLDGQGFDHPPTNVSYTNAQVVELGGEQKRLL